MTEHGNDLSGTIAAMTRGSDSQRWFDYASDPAAVEVLGRAIADAGRGHKPSAVVTWLSPDDTVLGHIVARELGVCRGAVDIDLGLLTLEPALPNESRVLLVASSFDDRHSIGSMRTLLEGQGHTLVASVSIAAAEDESPLTIVGFD